ncbi:TfoX/Sxy family protein [Variovorax sp. KK3]|uniref:TfoX/Sxy family protein n=1 Tax=Variovorax sp. KK3 TaxID=1855728 RepID=UPI00097BBFB7|nr:TfoX/Sxy family protein [Variovorax sp. KK3]
MSQFVQSLHEVFDRMGRIEARRMFGGHGLYHDGRMFGLVANDTLYLKADDQTLDGFQRRGLPAFGYERDGKRMEMSYRQAPEEIFEDREEALRWGRMAWEAAMRSGAVPKRVRAAAAKSAKSAKTGPKTTTKTSAKTAGTTKSTKSTKAAKSPAAKKSGKR